MKRKNLSIYLIDREINKKRNNLCCINCGNKINFIYMPIPTLYCSQTCYNMVNYKEYYKLLDNMSNLIGSF